MPSTVSVRVEDRAVKVGLEKFGAAVPNITREEMDDVMKEVKYEASGGYSGGASYAVPPSPSNSPRTGNYGRSTYVDRDGLTYRVKNDAYSERGFPYGVLVGGTGTGTGQKYPWWPLIKDVVNKLVGAKLVAKIESRLGAFLRGIGMGS